jgi:hypothetical protein
MQDGRRPVGRERVVERIGLADITLNQWSPSHRPAMTGDQIVENDRQEAALRQELAGMAPDVPGSAGDQNRARVRPRHRHGPSRPGSGNAILDDRRQDRVARRRTNPV